MEDRFPNKVFRGAAIYGVIALLPLYFAPWPTLPETYVGFVGLALVFQGVFWVIGSDPRRYRALMPLAVAEKLVFAVPALVLVALGCTQATTGAFAAVDLLLAVLFCWAWRRTPREDA